MKVKELEELAKRIKIEVEIEETEIQELENILDKFSKLKLGKNSSLKRMIGVSLDLEELKKLTEDYCFHPINPKNFRHNALVSDQNLVVIRQTHKKS